MMLVLAFDTAVNLSLVAAEAVALFILWRKRKAKVFAAILAALGIAVCFGAFLSVAVVGLFGAMRAVAWALFLHVPLFLAAAAALLWKPHSRVALAAAGVSALILTVAVDAFFIEPRVLEVNRAQLVSPKLKRPLRIAVVADIQTDEIGAYEREALRRVAEEKPDLLLFAGDYLQEYDPSRRGTLIHQLRSALVESGLADHPAAFAVQGNCDADDWEESFGNTRIARVAETTDIRGPEFHLTALSMRDSFDTRLSVPESNQFHIVLGHSPDFALGSIQADLLIAGHTHGGQVRLPLIGPLITLSRIPRSWAAGVTELPGGRTLVVARGVGMERGIAPRLRFLCRPEVVIVEVAPSEVR